MEQLLHQLLNAERRWRQRGLVRDSSPRLEAGKLLECQALHPTHKLSLHKECLLEALDLTVPQPPAPRARALAPMSR